MLKVGCYKKIELLEDEGICGENNILCDECKSYNLGFQQGAKSERERIEKAVEIIVDNYFHTEDEEDFVDKLKGVLESYNHHAGLDFMYVEKLKDEIDKLSAEMQEREK